MALSSGLLDSKKDLFVSANRASAETRPKEKWRRRAAKGAVLDHSHGMRQKKTQIHFIHQGSETCRRGHRKYHYQYRRSAEQVHHRIAQAIDNIKNTTSIGGVVRRSNRRKAQSTVVRRSKHGHAPVDAIGLRQTTPHSRRLDIAPCRSQPMSSSLLPC